MKLLDDYLTDLNTTVPVTMPEPMLLIEQPQPTPSDDGTLVTIDELPADFIEPLEPCVSVDPYPVVFEDSVDGNLEMPIIYDVITDVAVIEPEAIAEPTLYIEQSQPEPIDDGTLMIIDELPADFIEPLEPCVSVDPYPVVFEDSVDGNLEMPIIYDVITDVTAIEPEAIAEPTLYIEQSQPEPIDDGTLMIIDDLPADFIEPIDSVDGNLEMPITYYYAIADVTASEPVAIDPPMLLIEQPQPTPIDALPVDSVAIADLSSISNLIQSI